MRNEDEWQQEEWVNLENRIDASPEQYKAEFKDWLISRPALWHKFVEHALTAVKKKDPYGYSAVALIGILMWDEGPNFFRETDYRFVPDLGKLLIELHPQTLDVLWRGERYTHPLMANGQDMAEQFEEMHPEHRGFFLSEEEDPHNKVECRVFPELFGLPHADPSSENGAKH